MAEQNQSFVYQANMFVDNKDDRQKLYEALDTFLRTRDMQELADSLQELLNKTERLRVYDAARPLIPMENQMDYNLMTPYISQRSRTVKLTRQKNLPYGFAIRGGKEHGTGVFISEVVPESEAHLQGLKVGDQIVKVNGFHLDEAVHQEVISLLKSRTELILKVKSVGLIPVKNMDDHEDEVFVDEQSESKSLIENDASVTSTANAASTNDNNNDTRGTEGISRKTVDPNDGALTHHRKTSSSASAHSGEFLDVRMRLQVGAHNTFGCNICKGPADHPGIFIQSINEGGLAYEAGLRLGDQLLEANGMKLNKVAFHEAVDYIKSFDEVELLVRKGVGAYLFPGESSGYNSSNSSMNDESGIEEYHSPLPAVTEEENSVLVDDGSGPSRIKDSRASEVTLTGQSTYLTTTSKTATLPDSPTGNIGHKGGEKDHAWSEKAYQEMFKRKEESEREVQERIEEKLRYIEYGARLETQQVDEEIIDHALEFEKQRRASSEVLANQESTSEEDRMARPQILDTESGKRGDIETVLQNVEKAETGMDTRFRTSSSSSDETKKIPNKETRSKQGDRWQKTVLAEIHNTPSPSKLNNSQITAYEEDSIETEQYTGTEKDTISQDAIEPGENRNLNENQQQKVQHDQLIKEFKKVHQKMIALQSEDAEPKAKERTVKIEMKPVSILKKPTSDRNVDELSPKPTSRTQIMSLGYMSTKPTAVSPVIERKELEDVLKNLKRTTNGLQDLPKEKQGEAKEKTSNMLPDVVTIKIDKSSVKIFAESNPTKGYAYTSHTIQSKEPFLGNDLKKKAIGDENQSTDKPTIAVDSSNEFVAVKNGKTKAITDSSLRIPKPPNYFFPKSKTPVQVIVQSYQSGVHQVQKPSPQRIEFLKSHPSIEIEIADGKNKEQHSEKSQTTNDGIRSAQFGVTKILVNKSDSGVQKFPVKEPTVRETQTRAKQQDSVPTSANSKPITSSINVQQAIEKFKVNTEKNNTPISKVKSDYRQNGTGNTQPVQTNTVANGKLDIKIGSTSRSNVQSAVSLPKTVPLKASADIRNEANGVNDRLARRQRTPTTGDHKVSIQILPEPLVIISSQK